MRFFYVENLCLLEKKDVIEKLIELNKNVASPILPELINGKKTDKSNFWGATDGNGYRKDSKDYIAIVRRKTKGCFSVPFVGACYLVKRRVFEKNRTPYTREGSAGYRNLDADIAFVKNLTYDRVLFHADNRFDYGRTSWEY